MDLETQRIIARIQLYELLRQHPDQSNRTYAGQLNRSEKWVRKWRARFKAHPPQTLADFFSESRTPHSCPQAIAPCVQDAVAELRETLSVQYNRPAGAALIHVELKQRPDLASYRLPKSRRTITKILRERGYIVSPRKRVRHPLPLTAPMEEWEMDFCEVWVRGEGPFEFFLVVDRGTSRVIHLEGCPGYHSESALMAVARLFTLYGLPKRLRFDRDARWVASWTSDSFPAPLVRFLRVLGVEPVICPPRRPDKKPYVEHGVKTLKYEWLGRHVWTTHAELEEVASQFKAYYHRQRRHFGAACQGETPDQAFPVLPSLPEVPQTVQPNAWLTHYHRRFYRRRVSSGGVIQIDKSIYYVGPQYAKRQVWAMLDANARQFHIIEDGKILTSLPIQGLQAEEATLSSYIRTMQDEARSIARYRQMKWQQVGEIA